MESVNAQAQVLVAAGTGIALSILVLILLFIHTFWVAAGFVLHFFDRVSRHRAVPSLASYVMAMVREWWFELVTVVTYPLGWLPPFGPQNFDPDGGPPVVLVHGYVRNRASLFALYWRLRRLGYRNVYPMALGRTFDPIEVQGRRLLDQLRAIASLADGAPLLAVGHSLGGVALRWCLQQEGAPTLGKIITLGTPHHGTRTAFFGPGTGAVQLRPKSDFLKTLDDPPAVPFTAIYSQLDNIVIPADSAKLGSDVVQLRDRGHMTLVYDGQAFDAVAEALEGAPTADAVTAAASPTDEDAA